MRQSLTVHIPQNQDVSYSLYAAGSKIAVPVLSDNQGEYIFKFTGGTPVVLFYTFQNIKRAFVVTAWQDERDGEPVTLPGVDGKLCLIARFKGYRIRLLDELLKQLIDQDEHYIFTQPLLFWYRLAAVIQYAKTKQTAIETLLKGL
ncbi:MAG: hypothetical protein II821_00460 [Treponema sp.]|nr:hypothetical protein [Treponema sp.]